MRDYRLKKWDQVNEKHAFRFFSKRRSESCTPQKEKPTRDTQKQDAGGVIEQNMKDVDFVIKFCSHALEDRALEGKAEFKKSLAAIESRKLVLQRRKSVGYLQKECARTLGPKRRAEGVKDIYKILEKELYFHPRYDSNILVNGGL